MLLPFPAELIDPIRQPRHTSMPVHIRLLTPPRAAITPRTLFVMVEPGVGAPFAFGRAHLEEEQQERFNEFIDFLNIVQQDVDELGVLE